MRRVPPFTRSRVSRRSKKIGARELTTSSMDLVLNRSHSKANELKVGTGEALALAQARRGFFSPNDEELKNYLHVTK